MDQGTFGTQGDRHRMAQQSRAAADAVWSSLLSGYGPHGGTRLLDLGDDVQLLGSAASGLTEQAADAALVPFQDLARSVRSAVGDQTTTATLLASGLVRAGFDAEADGVPRPVLVEGIRLARRQTLASLRAMSDRTDAASALGHVTMLGADAVRVVTEGLQAWNQDVGTVDLDAVDIVVEADAGPAWAEGSLARPQHVPDLRGGSHVGVLVVEKGWTIKPRSDGVVRRITDPSMLAAARAEDASRRRSVRDHLLAGGVGFIVCGDAVDEDLCLDLARRGVWVWTDAPKDARRRLAASTGATAVPDMDHLDPDAVGRADVRCRSKRQGGWWVMGPAMAATLVLPSLSPVAQAAVADDGERLLRAAGVVLADARAVPGGGRWQRGVSRALRKASVHAHGKHALAVEMVADVFDAMADHLVRNAGVDPLDRPLLPDADGVVDASPCVIAAVQAGFDAAVTLLRIDGRYDKKPSTPEALRGGSGPMGSPKGMPGDVPPLM